jgi:hypothetical protein
LLENEVTGSTPFFPTGVNLDAKRCKISPKVEEVGVIYSEKIDHQGDKAPVPQWINSLEMLP